MHYHTLAVITIPPVEENQEETNKIQACIEELESKGSQNPDLGSVIRGIFTGRLRAQLNAFSREVYSSIDNLMHPYGSESEDCYEFIDMTEELRDAYENDTIDCYRLPGGRIVTQFDNEVYRKFSIRDGIVFEKNAGPLKHPKRTHKAKKMKALPDYPMKKLYATFEDYAKNYRFHEYHEDKQAFGYYCNPEARWDWFVIGGRWPITFLVKDTCTEYSPGERTWGDENTVYPVPEGYMWVSAARKKDIEWEAMRNWQLHQIKQQYLNLTDMYVNKTLQPPEYLREIDGCVYHYSTLLYKIGETEEEFSKRMKADEIRQFPVSFADLVDGYNWFDEGEDYVRPDETEVTAETWDETVQQFIEDQSDEDVFVSIDYHM